MLGTEELYTYLGKYGLELDRNLEELLGKHSRKVRTERRRLLPCPLCRCLLHLPLGSTSTCCIAR